MVQSAEAAYDTAQLALKAVLDDPSTKADDQIRAKIRVESTESAVRVATAKLTRAENAANAAATAQRSALTSAIVPAVQTATAKKWQGFDPSKDPTSARKSFEILFIDIESQYTGAAVSLRDSHCPVQLFTLLPDHVASLFREYASSSSWSQLKEIILDQYTDGFAQLTKVHQEATSIQYHGPPHETPAAYGDRFREYYRRFYSPELDDFYQAWIRSPQAGVTFLHSLSNALRAKLQASINDDILRRFRDGSASGSADAVSVARSDMRAAMKYRHTFEELHNMFVLLLRDQEMQRLHALKPKDAYIPWEDLTDNKKVNLQRTPAQQHVQQPRAPAAAPSANAAKAKCSIHPHSHHTNAQCKQQQSAQQVSAVPRNDAPSPAAGTIASGAPVPTPTPTVAPNAPARPPSPKPPAEANRSETPPAAQRHSPRNPAGPQGGYSERNMQRQGAGGNDKHNHMVSVNDHFSVPIDQLHLALEASQADTWVHTAGFHQAVSVADMQSALDISMQSFFGSTNQFDPLSQHSATDEAPSEGASVGRPSPA